MRERPSEGGRERERAQARARMMPRSYNGTACRWWSLLYYRYFIIWYGRRRGGNRYLSNLRNESADTSRWENRINVTARVIWSIAGLASGCALRLWELACGEMMRGPIFDAKWNPCSRQLVESRGEMKGERRVALARYWFRGGHYATTIMDILFISTTRSLNDYSICEPSCVQFFFYTPAGGILMSFFPSRSTYSRRLPGGFFFSCRGLTRLFSLNRTNANCHAKLPRKKREPSLLGVHRNIVARLCERSRGNISTWYSMVDGCVPNYFSTLLGINSEFLFILLQSHNGDFHANCKRFIILSCKVEKEA